MKPREFDDLVRQKFDQNDFAYNPANWDRLAEQLDGREKKRSMMMWFWMPAMGLAASVAMAFGVTAYLNMDEVGAAKSVAVSQTQNAMVKSSSNAIAMLPTTTPAVEMQQERIVRKATKTIGKPAPLPEKDLLAATSIGLKFHNLKTTAYQAVRQEPIVDLAAAVPTQAQPVAAHPTEKTETKNNKVISTFRNSNAMAANTMRKPINLSVTLAGGISQGNRNSGYMAGANVRKMINDKVFVESDIAFAASDNVQQTMILEGGAASISGATSGATAGKPSTSASKTTADGVMEPGVGSTLKMKDVNYSLYYAQVTPSIGYKIMKRMAIGVGPDFQTMLVDNRPAKSEVDRGNIQVAPTFDVGFVGRTEYALSQRIKAAVAYRKGVNGVINPSDKFIDRDYVQFQMRCTVFNR